jgi:kynureninase
MVLLEVPDAEKLTDYLKTHGIYTDSRRNEVVRMAPFLWNTEAEVNRTFDRIEEGLDTGAYREVTASSAGPVT